MKKVFSANEKHHTRHESRLLFHHGKMEQSKSNVEDILLYFYLKNRVKKNRNKGNKINSNGKENAENV